MALRKLRLGRRAWAQVKSERWVGWRSWKGAGVGEVQEGMWRMGVGAGSCEVPVRHSHGAVFPAVWLGGNHLLNCSLLVNKPRLQLHKQLVRAEEEQQGAALLAGSLGLGSQRAPNGLQSPPWQQCPMLPLPWPPSVSFSCPLRPAPYGAIDALEFYGVCCGVWSCPNNRARRPFVWASETVSAGLSPVPTLPWNCHLPSSRHGQQQGTENAGARLNTAPCS